MVLTFKLADDVVSSLKNVLLARGFVEFVSSHHAAGSWNFQWKTTRYSDLESIGPEQASSHAGGPADQQATTIRTRQKINHFQKTTGICRKDTLARNLRRMLKTWGSIYSYAPQTYILPRELKEFEHEISQQQNSAGEVVWICKPSSSSQGKNIFLITKLSELTYDCSFVVQRYIANPMLIGGYKYDLRIYVLVTSFRPLCVYMYREGLARFSSQKYDPSDMGNLFSHLTNASINKESPDLNTDKEVIGSGCKWTMARWFTYLETIGVNPYVVWERIKDIAILTLLPIVAEVPDNTRCFELFGFDIMLDEHYSPWIIEVNASPAIAISGMQDTTVKIPLLNDLLDAIGFPAEECLAQVTNTDNILPPNHVSFDPLAQQKAIAVAHATAQAAAGAASANSSAATNLVHNTANRGDKVQRLPRIVKMQTQQGRSVISSAAASAAATAPATPVRRRPSVELAAATMTASKIPRMPSQSPSRSPTGSHARTRTPSRIPIRRKDGVDGAAEALSPRTKRSTLPPTKLRSRSAETAQPAPGTATTAATAASLLARQRSTAQRSALAESITAVTAAAMSTGSGRARARSRAPLSTPSLSSSSSSHASSGFVSTGLAPELIGDFERIFPFDAGTAASSDSIATSSVLRSKSSAAVAPMAVLFSQFAKSTVSALKSRIRARDRVIADRAKDPALPLRHAFVATSNLPSPWTPHTIAAAVQCAKDAARAERVRIGLPAQAPAGAQAAEEAREATDESLQLELAITAANRATTDNNQQQPDAE